MGKKRQMPDDEEAIYFNKDKEPREKTDSEIAYEKLFQDMVDEFRRNYQPSETPEGCEFMTTASIIDMWSTIAPGLTETTVNTFMVQSGFCTRLIGGEFKWLVRAVKQNNFLDY